jgi:hypothetical protein
MGRCITCGADLPGGSERFCGGDRCARVLMKPPDHGRPRMAAWGTTDGERTLGRGVVASQQEAGDEVAPGVLQRKTGNLGALRH